MDAQEFSKPRAILISSCVKNEKKKKKKKNRRRRGARASGIDSDHASVFSPDVLSDGLR